MSDVPILFLAFARYRDKARGKRTWIEEERERNRSRSRHEMEVNIDVGCATTGTDDSNDVMKRSG